MPTFRSAMMSGPPKGTTTNAATKPVITTYGASLKSGTSAADGTMSSFSTLLMPSASHWRKPAGPVRFGPMRLWIRPATRRSTQVVIPAIGRMKTNTTMPPKTSIAPREATHSGRPPGTKPSATRLSTSSCIGLPVDLRSDQVKARDHGDQVGDHEIPAHLLDDAHRGERARADLAAVRERGAVAHHVPAHVAARALEPHVAVSGGRLEVARHLGDHRALRELRQALAKDLAALLHLAHADHVAVEAVAERAELAAPDRHVEVELGIDGVRQVAPDVVADAGTAQVRADAGVVDRRLPADGGHVSQPLRVYLVVGDERVVLVDQRLETLEEGERLLAPPWRDVPRHAADPHVVEREPRAAELLDQVVDVFALADGMDERRVGADVHRHRADGQEMNMDAVELGGDVDDVLCPLGHIGAREPRGRHRPALVAEHRRHVVDAIGVRHEAVPADLLRDLLDGPVEVADVRDGFLHHLAVGTHHEAEHAVGRGVLGPHAEGHVLGGETAVDFALDLDLESREAHVFSRLSRDVEMPWYSSGSTKSLRSGCPGQSSGMRMRRRSGWPSKVTPSRSNTSRSCHSAADHTPATLGTAGLSRGASTFSTNRWR